MVHWQSEKVRDSEELSGFVGSQQFFVCRDTWQTVEPGYRFGAVKQSDDHYRYWWVTWWLMIVCFMVVLRESDGYIGQLFKALCHQKKFSERPIINDILTRKQDSLLFKIFNVIDEGVAGKPLFYQHTVSSQIFMLIVLRCNNNKNYPQLPNFKHCYSSGTKCSVLCTARQRYLIVALHYKYYGHENLSTHLI